jgi:hypothetical protein
MDTRFWGPSGWKLLHHIAFSYTPTLEHRIQYAVFLDTLPYILPCKFCRASLTDYYREHPYAMGDLGLHPTLDLGKWMVTIHNCVNDKLRKQGLHPAPNPTYPQVKRQYESHLRTSWKQQLALFWDFLFSVGYHHPKERHLYAEPMPNCPPEAKKSRDLCERNKWNILPQTQRMTWFRRFWLTLPDVLPPALAPHWKRAEATDPPTLDTRDQTMNWLWRMRCTLDTSFYDPYRSVCKAIAAHASDCAVQKGAFTCRASRRKTRKRGRR